MLSIFGIGLLALVLVFSLVVFFGAPYLPTLRGQIQAALGLLDLPKGSTILELGSGDGKVLLVAAEAGYNVVGIEINPVLVVVSLVRTRRYRSRVKVIWGSFWSVRWPEADGVYVFLVDRFMTKLDRRMQMYKKPLASVAFRVPGRTAKAQRQGVFLYDYR